jgi:hypothetical protein
VKRTIASVATFLGLILGLSACTNPYDPAQRFVGGGLLEPVLVRRSELLLAADPGRPLVLRSAVPQVPLEASPPRRRRRTATAMDTQATPAITAIPVTMAIMAIIDNSRTANTKSHKRKICAGSLKSQVVRD